MASALVSVVLATSQSLAGRILYIGFASIQCNLSRSPNDHVWSAVCSGQRRRLWLNLNLNNVFSDCCYCCLHFTAAAATDIVVVLVVVAAFVVVIVVVGHADLFK